MSPLTPPGQTRDKIYQFMRSRLLEGLPPTVREVQQNFGFRAVQTAKAHLDRLVAEGRLVKMIGKARGYSLPASIRAATMLVPLLGRVQAGDLNTAIEDCEGYIPIESRGPHAHPPGQARPGPRDRELFALRVQGESMTGVAILPGDIAIVRSQPTADPGDIVVALVGDEATIKTLRILRGQIVLQPENPDFEPIVPGPNECTILGKVIETRRYIEAPTF